MFKNKYIFYITRELLIFLVTSSLDVYYYPISVKSSLYISSLEWTIFMKIYWNGTSKNIIGSKVKQLRQEKRLSQAALANQLQLLGMECSDLTILRIEQGSRFVPDYEVAMLAKYFNISTDVLLEQEDIFSSIR